jgi:hypothetical protein
MTVNSCGIVICVCGLRLWFSTHDIHDMYDGTIYHGYQIQLEVPSTFRFSFLSYSFLVSFAIVSNNAMLYIFK